MLLNLFLISLIVLQNNFGSIWIGNIKIIDTLSASSFIMKNTSNLSCLKTDLEVFNDESFSCRHSWLAAASINQENRYFYNQTVYCFEFGASNTGRLLRRWWGVVNTPVFGLILSYKASSYFYASGIHDKTHFLSINKLIVFLLIPLHGIIGLGAPWLWLGADSFRLPRCWSVSTLIGKEFPFIDWDEAQKQPCA